VKLFKWALLVALLLIAVLFVWQNQDLLSQRLPVVLQLPLVDVQPLPPDGPRIDQLLVAAALSGFFLGYLLPLLGRLRTALEVRRLRREVAALQASPRAHPTGSEAPARPAETTRPPDTDDVGTVPQSEEPGDGETQR